MAKRFFEFQQKAIGAVCAEADIAKRILLQLPTGAGKTFVAANIAHWLREERKWNIWFVVPRLELLGQARKEFVENGNNPCGEISAKKTTPNVYTMLSADTLAIRLKNGATFPAPQCVFFDETHIGLERIAGITRHYPQACVIGLTATPERMSAKDKMPLSHFYQRFFFAEEFGADIPSLVELGRLSQIRYYLAPQAQKWKPEYDRFGNLLKSSIDAQNVLFGDVVSEYQRLANGKRGLGFCNSVKQAYDMAGLFNARGVPADGIDGGESVKKRRDKIDRLKSGELKMLCCADLLTYGCDIPECEYAFSVRPCKNSRALFMQIVGRIMRVANGKEAGIFCDHVMMGENHRQDGRLLFNVESIRWDIKGLNRYDPTLPCVLIGQEPKEGCEKKCQKNCGLYADAKKLDRCAARGMARFAACEKEGCLKNCALYQAKDATPELLQIHCRLIEDEREKIHQENRGRLKTAIDAKDVATATEAYMAMGKKPLGVFFLFDERYKLDTEEKRVFVLERIATAANFKDSWVAWASGWTAQQARPGFNF